MKKKLVSLMLITSMIAGLATGCGSKKATTNKDGKEVIELSMMWCEGANAPLDEDWLALKLVEEKAGVKLNIQAVPSSDYETKRQITMNSGNIPDIVAHTFASPNDALNGLLLPISDYIDEMPNFKKHLEEHDLMKYVDNGRISDGKFYTFPVNTREHVVQDHQWLVRKDILDKNNIPMPTTLDELADVGKKLKEIYPDSTPISCRFGVNNIMAGLASGYGTIAGWTYGDGMYYDHDAKKWTFAPTSDAFKDLATLVNKMYTSGALDQEVSTLDATVFEQNLTNGKIFITYDWASNCTGMNKEGKEVDPDFEMVPMPAPQGYEGKYALQWNGANSQGWVFPATIKDEDYFEDFLAFLDWCYTDEGAEALTFGKEGESFQVKDGVKQWMDDEKGEDHQALYGLTTPELSVREDMDMYKYPNVDKAVEDIYKIANDKKMIPMTNPGNPLDASTVEALSVKVSSVKDYVVASLEKFMNGQMPLSDWDKYVKECNAKGATDIQKAYEDAVK